VVCWGENFRYKWVVSADLEPITAICCGADHIAALTADGRIRCWGSTADGVCSVPPLLVNVVGVN
jgi:alpha-tubulin suppressor-like RCC1 family protein